MQPDWPSTDSRDRWAQNNQWGTRHTLALTLASLQLDVVHRDVLHTLTWTHRPAATTANNHTRKRKVQAALYAFAERGWVTCTPTAVRVVDRRALLEFVVSNTRDRQSFEWVQAAILEIRELYNQQFGTPQAARAGRRRRHLTRLATERPQSQSGVSPPLGRRV